MDKQGIEALVQISHYAGSDVAYIQGGGGNTSLKLDERRMAVKASGCQLSDMADHEGYVVVDYQRIGDYFRQADSQAEDFDTESAHVLKAAKLQVEGIKDLRPSVEAGFHSLLKKYVVHTHSVYSNVLCCSQEGEGVVSHLFEDYACIWLEYVNPGALLTSVIAKRLMDLGQVPDIIFMKNHGVIVTADTADKAMALHEMVNNRIKDYLKIEEDFPTVKVEELEGKVVSASNYVKAYFDSHQASLDFVRDKVLYPDQLVYLNNSIFKKDGSPSDIIFRDGALVYNTSKKQAQVNEETLVAYLYVLNCIEEKKLTLVSMSHEDQAFILGWESEAYRKSMLK